MVNARRDEVLAGDLLANKVVNASITGHRAIGRGNRQLDGEQTRKGATKGSTVTVPLTNWPARAFADGTVIESVEPRFWAQSFVVHEEKGMVFNDWSARRAADWFRLKGGMVGYRRNCARQGRCFGKTRKPIYGTSSCRNEKRRSPRRRRSAVVS